jgi:hypothetical protein
MGEILRFGVLDIFDIFSGILVFYTQSFIPLQVAYIHSGVLIFKGTGGLIRPLNLPFPVFVLGGMADVLSAAILYTGTPPILPEFKGWIAAVLFVKGFWTLFSFLDL